MNDNNKTVNYNTEIINLIAVFKKIKNEKKIFYKTLPIVFVLSCLYIICIPRYYTSSLSLAPEIGNAGMSGTLGSIASSFGFDLNNAQTTDAIYPLLYPDLMEDNGFVVDMFKIKVESADEEIKCDYYDYLKKYQKQAWWAIPIGAIKNIFKGKEENVKRVGQQNPYILSKAQDEVVEKIKKDIKISTDKKTAVITISVTAQDPLICKTLADSVKEKLQLYITKYRTNKARIDESYYKKLANEALKDYEKARQLYASFADANMNISLESYRSKQTDLENDMQLKYNTYSTIMAQYQAAKAKVQERTPAFTVVKGAAVPIKPAGPKRMLFVAIIMILTVFSITAWILMKNILGKE